MAPLSKAFYVSWLVLNLVLNFGKAQTCMSSVEQPVVSSIDPPSGTTGTNNALSSRYVIIGERLDQVREITADVINSFQSQLATLDLVDTVQENTSISFHFALTPLPSGGVDILIALIPNNSDCSTLMISISVHDTVRVSLDVATQAQPGTTIATTLGTCLPSICGDNSTMYNAIVGGVVLDLIEGTSDSLIARFPEFTTTNNPADFVISTQYQMFTLSRSTQFTLFLQTSDAVVIPTEGQRGTRITITGTKLLGYGDAISLSQVTIGDITTEVLRVSEDMDTIELRASSGPPGVASISINTTQSLTGDTYDGPYTFLENAWTYLVDGFISEITPPAVQVGGSVTLCGSRLLGGGVSIAEVNLAGLSSSNFSATPAPPIGPQPGDECISAVVPDLNGTSNVLGLVEIVADTGALVQSMRNFIVAEIQEVTPMRGQPGTIVTIRGVALLSGYTSGDVTGTTVTLNGIEASLRSASDTEVIVQALEPSNTNRTVVGESGAVIIAVQGPGLLSSLTFSVTSDAQSWTYEPPGAIDSVSPAFGQFGTLLTINGTNLLSYGMSLTRATVGGMDATVVEMTDTLVRLRAPDGPVGIVDIVLAADNGAEVRGVDLFEFRMRGSISQVFPDSGQRGTFVSISGTNLFGFGDNITSVTFGDIPATIDFTRSNSSLVNVRIQSNTRITQDTGVLVTITSDTSAVVESAAPIWTYLVQGTVTDIQPPVGQEGTRVTLTGTNLLGGGNSAVRVLVDDAEGRIITGSVTDTRIDVVMGSVMARDFPGQAFIMADTGATVMGGSYTHQSSGTISNFSPTVGRRGTMVTITGQNLLGFGDSITMVTVAGNSGTIISFDNSQVVVQVGPGMEDETGPIRLLINTGAVITSAGNFTYVPPGTITDVIDPDGAEGIGVLIRGSALFPSNTQLTSVTIGGNPVSRVVTATPSEISVIVGTAPATNPMMAEIVITASDGSFVDNAFFRFVELVISLPEQTSGREGTLLAITLPASPAFDVAVGLRATVDDEEAEIVSSSTGMITVQVPRAKRVGTFTADVAIENPQRLVARLPDSFMYLPEGVIYIVTPNIGQRGTRVVIEGENLLGGGTVISSAMLSGVSARVMSSSDESAVVEIMENPGASTTYPFIGNILLEADTGAITLRLNGFTIAQPGDIRTVSPASGQAGTRVTITGTDLLQGGEDIQQITLAGVQATVIGDPSDTSITVEAAPSGPLLGPVEITLTTGALITSEQNLMFEYLQVGQISMLVPNQGTLGTRVVINGDNLLGGGNNVTQVLLDGVEAVVVSFTNDNVTVIAQAAQPTSPRGDVEITADTGARVLRESFWTYSQLGSITSVDPPVGQQGIEVTLQGSALLGYSGTSLVECRLAGITGTVMQISRTSVVCRAGFFPDLISQPENGTGPAELLTDTGVVIRSEQNITFTYYIAQIDTVTPRTGNNGTIVRISGANLVGFPGEGSTVASVVLGAVAATVITSNNNDIIVRAGLSMSAQDNSVRVSSSDGSFQELSNAWTFSPLKEIISVSPMIAFPGDTVIIAGLNFDSPPNSGIVVIVGQTSSVEARVVNDTTIEFVVGVHQSTDNAGEPLPVQIVYDTGETVFEPSVTFTYNETRGIIESVTPTAGAENTVVRITGRNLLGNQTVTQVSLAGVAATVRDNSTNEEIVVIAGAGPSQGGFGTVVIETSDRLQFGLGGDAWRYYPVLTAGDVSPTSGQNGTVVTVDLSTVDPLPSIENVTLVGSPALDFSADPNGVVTVTVETTDSVNIIGDIVIFFADSTQLIITNAWTHLDSVQVTSFSPSEGYFNSLVSLNGQNFQAGGLVTVTSVYLASLETQIIAQSDTRLELRITELRSSESQAIEGPVVIVSDQGATYTSSVNFTYVQARVDSVEPQQGQRGTRVNITGVGLLLGGSSVSTVMLGDVPAAAVISATDTEIIVSAAPFPSQTNVSDIVYTLDTEAQLTVPDSWRYIVPGEVTSVSPEEGGMGTIVTIMGVNLFGGGNSAETVLLNNVPAESIVTNFDNLIQVVAGESATSLSPGNVQVVSDTGAVTESTMNVAYTYLTPGEIAMVTPREGQNGTRLTIEGSFLHNGEGVSRILLAGVEATIDSTTEDFLLPGFPSTFEVRAGRPSTPHSFSGPITVISHFNTMSVSNFNFTYLSEGVVFSVTPAQGQVGTVVMIEGENLLGGGNTVIRAYLAGVMAAIIGTPTNSRVQVRASLSPEAVLGDIVLVSDSGAYVRRVDGWSYVDEGTVMDIRPRQGQWGTRIVITGVQLLSGGESVERALLDDVELEVTSSSATRIEARIGEPASPDAFNASNITLVSNFGGTLTQTIQWLFLNQSVIDDISPSSGFGNTEVMINGTDLLGGGTRIVSAIMDNTVAAVTLSNDTNVVLVAGFNPNGQERTGDIRLVSDTGAITVEVNGWTYDNECPDGQYGNFDSCLPCDEECSTCDGPNSTDCFTCRNFAIELANTTTYFQCVPACANVSTLSRICRDACESDEFSRVNSTENVTFCQPCNPQCDINLSCSGPEATQCGSCRNVLNVLNQTCIEECPLGTYQDELNRCVPCDSQCTLDGGCTGPNSTDCAQCANVYVNVMLGNGIVGDACLQNCSSLYYQAPGSDVCAPCDGNCLEGCTGLSPFECVGCRGPSFVFSNGTTKCVSTCNPDSMRVTLYEDSRGVCLPCSSRCSLTRGCSGPTAFDCNGCRLYPNSVNSLPTLEGECVSSCPNANSTYSFYADNTTNVCEPCDRACSDGCTGPGAENCIQLADLLVAGGGAIAIFVIILLFVLAVVVILIVYVLYQRKHSVYKVSGDEEDGLMLSERETSITSPTKDNTTRGITNVAFDGGEKDAERPTELVTSTSPEESIKKSEGETGSQDLLYTEMSPGLGASVEEPRYSTPTPKSLRKAEKEKEKEEEPPARPAPYKKLEQESKPPPPRPPSPSADGDLYTDMEAGIHEVHINPVAEEEYSEMAPAPIAHQLEELYDDAESVQPVVSAGKPPAPTPKSEEQAPLLEDLYEDAETAVAQVNEYKRNSRAEPPMISNPQNRFSGVPEKVPDLPSRPAPKKRPSVPLPETPLQKSLSSSTVSSMSPVHQPPPISLPTVDDIYIEPSGPIEESLYEELPTGEASHTNELPLPPRPKK